MINEYGINVEGMGVLVTGGSQGLGRAICDGFVSCGAKVIIADMKRPDDVPLINESDEALRYVNMDLTNPESVMRGMEQVLSCQDIHVLINNAGIIFKASAENMDIELWQKVLDINLTGAMLCTKAVATHMKKEGRGRIINISSMQAYMGTATYGAYTASKAALSGITRVWAAEFAPFGITVNGLCPSYVDTPMVKQSIERYALENDVDMEESFQHFVGSIPQKRILDPKEVAFAALFLASPLAQSITGQNILTAGGAVMN